MALSPYKAPSGFLLPSIHSAPPFFTQQPNPATLNILSEQWRQLILSYARFRKLFVLRVDDAEREGTGDWDEILRNPRINRRLPPPFLNNLLATLVEKNEAFYDPIIQTRSVILCWRQPEEWAELLHDWATSTGQLGTILTFYEIVEPQVTSEISNLPIPLLKKAIDVLSKSARAQTIAVSDGEGVRFLPGRAHR